MAQRHHIVVCELSTEARRRLLASGVKDPHGVTQVFKTAPAARRCAADWIASGLGRASLNGQHLGA